MSPASPHRVLLRILSGVHVGAEVGLAPGEYSIGRDETCGLVLLDRDIAPCHALLTIAEGNAIFRVAGGRLFWQGTATDQIAVAWFQIVSLGTVHLVLGPANALWPPLPAIDLTPPPVSDPFPAPPESPPATAELSVPVLPEAIPEPVPPAPARRLWHPYWLRGGIGLLALVALMQFIWPLFYAISPPSLPLDAKPAHTPLARLRERLATQGWRDLRLETNATPPKLLGYVPRIADLQTLKKIVEEVGARLNNRVVANEALVETASAVLRSQGHVLQVASQGAGRIAIAGITDHPEALAQDLEALKRDLPTVREIDNRVETRQSPLRALSEWIKAAGLTQIELVHFADRIVARGQPDAKAQKVFETLAKRYAAEFPALPLSVEFPALPKTSLPGFVGVMIGTHKVLFTDDDRSLGEGQALAPEVVIDRIEFDYVTLTAHGERKKVPIPSLQRD